MPVPPLESFVRSRTEHYDRAWLSDDPTFVHAHVTLLSPFVPGPLSASDRSRICDVLSRHRPFDFTLRNVATFPNGIVHLRPAPDGPFRALTADLVRALPQHPPYAGAFPDPTPHLTLDLVHGRITQASVTAAVAPSRPPGLCRADRIQLAWYAAHDCRVLDEWPLSRDEPEP